ncbi:MAG: hypothetical protein IJU50_01485 [Lachnospiraceae bacterium]|nr:hypothetical protein [Lachnospiraceae bacterium]
MAAEKEINCNLFDQLSIVERLKRAYDQEKFEDEYKIIVAEIERKLYQQPPKD